MMKQASKLSRKGRLLQSHFFFINGSRRIPRRLSLGKGCDTVAQQTCGSQASTIHCTTDAVTSIGT